MENQFALWLAIMFGFTSCTLTEEEQFEADLVGTWIEVRTTHSTDGSAEWVSTERKTVILERVNDRLRFRNCIDDTHATATILDEQVTLSGDDYPTLELSDDDTLTGVTAIDGAEVVLERYSSEVNAVMASLDLDQPGDLSDWTQICLETLVSESGDSRLAFKAINSVVGVTIGMNFESTTPFNVAQTLTYSSLNEDDIATGEYDVLGVGAGTLSEPNGTLIVSDNVTWDFLAEMAMVSTAEDVSSNPVSIDALLKVEKRWFETE